MESRKRQVRQFLQDTMQLDHQQQQQLESLPSIHSSTANSAPAGGFTADTTTATQQHHHQAEVTVLYCSSYTSVVTDIVCLSLADYYPIKETVVVRTLETERESWGI